MTRAAMDIIYLRDLRIETVIGVYDWEQRIRQTVVLNLELAGDAKKAAATDDIADTLDYKAIADRLIGFISTSKFKLVETLAESAAKIVITEFGASWIKLSVTKTVAITGATNVGISIERTKKDYA